MNRKTFLRSLALVALCAIAILPDLGAARRRWTPANSFNPITDLPWVKLWVAGTNTYNTGTTPATNGQTVQNFADVISGAVLTQPDGSLRPVYVANSANFNSKPTVKGVSPSALRWVRGSDLTPPYTVVIVGKFPAGVTGYSTLVANETTAFTFLWTSLDTSISEADYQGHSFFRNYNSQANVWAAGIAASGATSSRFQRNGASIVGQIDANNLKGITLFSYGTADAFYSEGEVAFVGILPDLPYNYPQWPALLRYFEQNYGIAITTGNLLINDGDSRNTGSSDITTSREGQGAYTDPNQQYGKQWGYLLQTDVTNPLQVVGLGVSGRTAATMITDFPNYVLPVVNESLAANKCLIYINAGINDILGGASASDAYTTVTTYVTTAHAAGLKVMLGTSCTFPTITGPQETARLALNVLVLANSAGADGTVDIAGDSISPQSNNQLNPNFHPENFNSSDLTHFNVPGNALVEALVKAALAAAPFNITYYVAPNDDGEFELIAFPALFAYPKAA